MNIRNMERRMKNTLKFQKPIGLAGGGKYNYSADISISKCRIEDKFEEKINSKGVEVRSKSHIITFEQSVPENSRIIEIDGVVLSNPEVVVSDAKTPTINYNAFLYEAWI